MRGRTTAKKLALLFFLVLLTATALVAVSHAFHEDPYKVLGIPRSASESEIKRAYRQLALKWHPDKNPGNPKAESEFMRIGSAYERLANGDTNPGGYASSSRQRQHQNPYSRQYQQQQQNYYRQQQYHVSVSFPMGIRAWQQGFSSNSTFPFSFLTIGFVVLLVWIMVILPSKTADSSPSQQQQQGNASNTNAKPEAPRSSPFDQLAKVFAPSIYAFNPMYLNARGRRMLLFFPNDQQHGCSVREQFNIIEKLAVEFQRDPLTFCWMDLQACATAERKKWDAQFNSNSAPFLVACSAKGKKIAMYPIPGKVTQDDLRQWLTRLLGGEISQRETIPDLFG